LRKIAQRFAGQTISFGESADADVRADAIEVRRLDDTRFRLTYRGIEFRAALPLAGKHFVLNALPAIALGTHYPIGLPQMIDSLSTLHQSPMRGRVLQFQAGFAVIDDSYNSNPRALSRMIETLAAISGYSRRILVAGEMLELGSSSPELHRQCGKDAARHG